MAKIQMPSAKALVDADKPKHSDIDKIKRVISHQIDKISNQVVTHNAFIDLGLLKILMELSEEARRIAAFEKKLEADAGLSNLNDDELFKKLKTMLGKK